MGQFLLTVLIAGFVLLGAGCRDRSAPAPSSADPGTEDKAPSPPGLSPEPGKEFVVILETSQGPITLAFFPSQAPEHVKNFIQHALSGYYTQTYFHRVMPGFMIQAGCPNTRDENPDNDGQGGHSYKGPGTFLKPEFNSIGHIRGIVSMARGNEKDTAGSQFFIMVADNHSLDRQYTVFGRVISGMGAVDAIVAQPGRSIPGAGGTNPTRHQWIQKVTVEQWTPEKIREAERRGD